MAKQPNSNGTGRPATTTLGVSRECHSRITRLAKLHGKPANWLVDRFSFIFERQWQRRMSADEWARYLIDISPRQAREIMRRDDGLDNDNGQAPAEPFVFDAH